MKNENKLKRTPKDYKEELAVWMKKCEALRSRKNRPSVGPRKAIATKSTIVVKFAFRNF